MPGAIGIHGQVPAHYIPQACAAHHPLDRESFKAEIRHQPAFQLPFRFGSRRELAVGGLAGHRHQPRWRGHPHRHPQAGAGPEDRHRCFGITSHRALQRHLLLILQVGKAVDQHSEIVHQLQPLQAAGLGQGSLIQQPGEVGELDAPCPDRTCHGKAGMLGAPLLAGLRA